MAIRNLSIALPNQHKERRKKRRHIPLIFSIFLLSCCAQASQCMFTSSSTVVISLTYLKKTTEMATQTSESYRHCFVILGCNNEPSMYINVDVGCDTCGGTASGL